MDLNRKFRMELQRPTICLGEMTLGEFIDQFGPKGYGVLKTTEDGTVDASEFEESDEFSDIISDFAELEQVAAMDFWDEYATLTAEELDANGDTRAEAERRARRAANKARHAAGRAQRAAARRTTSGIRKSIEGVGRRLPDITKEGPTTAHDGLPAWVGQQGVAMANPHGNQSDRGTPDDVYRNVAWGMNTVLGEWQSAFTYLKDRGFTWAEFEAWANEQQSSAVNPQLGLTIQTVATLGELGINRAKYATDQDAVATCLHCLQMWLCFDALLPDGSPEAVLPRLAKLWTGHAT
jgi:hypothetical protein